MQPAPLRRKKELGAGEKCEAGLCQLSGQGVERCHGDYTPCKAKESRRADKTRLVTLCREVRGDTSSREWGSLLLPACFGGRQTEKRQVKKFPRKEEWQVGGEHGAALHFAVYGIRCPEFPKQTQRVELTDSPGEPSFLRRHEKVIPDLLRS